MVWIGGLTLVLGGFFLVRYSIEAGLVGPRVRIFFGGLFALALLAAGEWTRRKESISDIVALPIANIPAILTAAGTAVAFATVYAAYALYGFLAPAIAFVLLGLVALGTLAVALLHGPALAGLGVVGAFVTPILVSSDAARLLGALHLSRHRHRGGLGLARIRLWRWLAVTTLAFALFWTLPCLDCGPSMVGPHAVPHRRRLRPRGPARGVRLPVRPGDRGWPDRADLIRVARRLSLRRHGDRAGELPCRYGPDRLRDPGRRARWPSPGARQRRPGAIGAAAFFVFIVFAEWAVRGNPDMLVLPGGALPGIGPNATDQSVTLHLVAAALFAAGFGLAGFLAQGRSSSAIIPVVWSARRPSFRSRC